MSNDLLLTRNQDESIMDIGKNCSKCNRLDFLPFQCEYCKQVFCSDHRRLGDHQCPGMEKFYLAGPKSHSPSPDYNQTAASLFPDRERDRAKIDRLVSKPYKPTNILEQTSFRVGDVSNSNVFKKFSKYLSLQKEKKDKKSGGIFGKKGTKVNPTVDLQLLRKQAKGDPKLSVADRVYVWVLFIDANVEEEEKMFQIDEVKLRKGFYVNKNWPVGRALDYISDELKIKNLNNKTTDVHNRLNMFRVTGDEQQLVKSSERCKDMKNGEILYLIRGSV